LSRPPDATEVDPLGHKVVFENEHVRILEVRSPAGQVIEHHSHPPRVVVAIGGFRIRSVNSDGVESTIDRRPGDAKWIGGEEHETEILIGPTHVIEVEVKAAR